MWFFIGMLVGAGLILLLPPERVSSLREWIINQWQKVTKKG